MASFMKTGKEGCINSQGHFTIDQNILPRIGAATVKEGTAPQEKFPVGEVLPATSETSKCTESNCALELFQVYRSCFFVSQTKNHSS